EPVPGNTPPGRARTRSARRPSRFSYRHPPLAGRSDDDAIVLQPFRLELETGQAAVLDSLAAEAEALVGLRECLGEFGDDAIRVHALPLGNLDQHLDFILAPIRGVEMDAKLVDLLELPDDRLDGARVDVGAAHQLHVVDPAADAALVEVEGAPAAAAAGRDPNDEIAGPVAQDGNEPPAEGGDETLTQLTVANRLTGLWVDHLLDVVILDDVGSARLLLALEDHD